MVIFICTIKHQKECPAKSSLFKKYTIIRYWAYLQKYLNMSIYFMEISDSKKQSLIFVENNAFVKVPF